MNLSELILPIIATATAIFSVLFAVTQYMSKHRSRIQRERILRQIAIITVSFSIIITIVIYIAEKNKLSIKENQLNNISSRIDKDLIPDMEKRIKILEEKLNSISIGLADSMSIVIANNDTMSNTNIIELKRAITENSSAISNFEKLFLSDAERLISLPILQREIKSTQNDLESMNESIKNLNTLLTESNSQNRWIIGTLALGMIGLIFSVVRGFTKETVKSNENTEK